MLTKEYFGIGRKSEPIETRLTMLTSKDVSYFYIFIRVRKLLNLRIFEDENGKRWNKSVKDYNYEILCISQVK